MFRQTLLPKEVTVLSLLHCHLQHRVFFFFFFLKSGFVVVVHHQAEIFEIFNMGLQIRTPLAFIRGMSGSGN